jgi:hypothetical protein
MKSYLSETLSFSSSENISEEFFNGYNESGLNNNVFTKSKKKGGEKK